MKIHTSKKSKEKQASAKKIHFSKSLFMFLILYCIAVLTGKGKFNVQIAAGDLNSEVEHIGVGVNRLGNMTCCFIDCTLDFSVYSVDFYAFKLCSRYVNILKG